MNGQRRSPSDAGPLRQHLRARQRPARLRRVTFALPHPVGGDGVLATIPLTLDDTERAGLRRSAGILRDAVSSLRLESKRTDDR